jgi:dipeptidyl aminopeptidase/acylaminoacyl peptidase
MGYMLTDGARVYVTQMRPDGMVLAEVSVNGGETLAVPTPIPNMAINDIDRDHSQLLVGSIQPTGRRETPLWALPLPAGAPRRLGNIVASDGSWSQDGKQLVFVSGSDLNLARADGSEPHRLISVAGTPFFPRFSPDGSRIRFSVQDQANTNSLWEVNADGSNLHPLLRGWKSPASTCCGRWTEDGRYYVFESTAGQGSNIFALRDSTGLFFRASRTPVQLTTGPVLYDAAVPGPNDRVFVQGTQPRAELIRYDPTAKNFVPFMGGISASDAAFSRDGKWVAYVSVPDGTLWRSRIDGTERMQLTFEPLIASLPRWSPDGSQIAFAGSKPGKPWKIYLVSAQGGSAEELLSENLAEMDPTWSADGSRLAFGRISDMNLRDFEIELVDVKTRQVMSVPGSKGLFSPRWSPDGRYIAALEQGSKRLMLYNFETQKWSEWFTEPNYVTYPSWSVDSRYIYYDNFASSNPKGRRIKLGENKPEDIYNLSGLRRYNGPWGYFSGQGPGDSRILVRDVSTQDIYALHVEFP